MTAARTLGDCEALRDGLLAQPANSLSSLAFMVVGGWVITRAVSLARGARWPGLALGAALVANGIGSAWYHGRPGATGQWLHDLAAIGLPLVIVAFDLTLRTPRGGRTALTAIAAALLVLAVVEVVWPDETNQWVVFLLLVLVIAEVQVARDNRRQGRPAWPPGHRGAKVVLAASLGVAVGANLLGASGGSACRPDSAWQFHALWHVAVAVAAGAYAVAVLEPRARHAHERVDAA